MTMNYFAAPGLKRKFPTTVDELIRNVIEVSCEVWDVPEEKLMSNDRSFDVAQARQFCVWYLYKETKMGTKKIGTIFGRDHSTVIHSRKIVEAALDGKHPYFYKKIREAMFKF